MSLCRKFFEFFSIYVNNPRLLFTRQYKCVRCLISLSLTTQWIFNEYSMNIHISIMTLWLNYPTAEAVDASSDRLTAPFNAGYAPSIWPPWLRLALLHLAHTLPQPPTLASSPGVETHLENTQKNTPHGTQRSGENDRRLSVYPAREDGSRSVRVARMPSRMA